MAQSPSAPETESARFTAVGLIFISSGYLIDLCVSVTIYN